MGQPELDDYHAARRPVARGKLQFHDMGRIERRGHDCLQVLERLPAGGPHALVVAHLVRNGSVICLCPRAYMEPAARLHAVHHGQCDYQMAVCAERLALALFRVGARMGRGSSPSRACSSVRVPISTRPLPTKRHGASPRKW